MFVKDKGVDLAAQRIEAEAPRPVDEQREFVIGRVYGDGAADEGEIAWIIERWEACDRRQLGAGGLGAWSDPPDKGDAAVRGGDTGDHRMKGLDLGECPVAFFRVWNGLGFFERFLARADGFGEAVLIEFRRLWLPPARRDIFGSNYDRLGARFRDREGGGWRFAAECGRGAGA